MPVIALGSQVDVWLTRSASSRAQLAAIGVVVENVVTGAKFTAWWHFETDRNNNTTHVAKDIWESARLKEHNRIIVVGIVALEYSLIHRRQSLLVKAAWEHHAGISDPVADIGFIERVKADNERVVGQVGTCCIPEVNKLILKTVMVQVKSIEGFHGLRRSVVISEKVLLAISN